MQTASTEDFRAQVQQGSHLFMVADEVHRIGSRENLKLLSLDTGPRLGLSATPRRAGDPDGTRDIFDYFNGVVPPPFTLGDAIRSGALTPYMYFVHTVTLSEQEQEEWDTISARINQLYAQNMASEAGNPNIEGRIQNLAIQRARVAKSAEDKVPLAVQVLLEQYEHGQKWIVYCDNQEQLYEVLGNTRNSGIDAKEYHSEMEGNKEQTLRYFEANGGIIVSMGVTVI